MRDEVFNRIKNRVFNSMLVHIKQDEKLNLWGTVKGRHFLKRSLVVALYRDMYAVGYAKLLNQPKN